MCDERQTPLPPFRAQDGPSFVVVYLLMDNLYTLTWASI